MSEKMARLEENLSIDESNLYELMSEISEDCWCAGWIGGNEYSLWAALHDGEMKFGMGFIDRALLAKVAALSVQTGKWIVWRDDDSIPLDQHGPYAIPLHEWAAIYDARNVITTQPAAQASAGSIGDDAEFVRLLSAWDHASPCRQQESFSSLATYIDSRQRQGDQAAPSDRISIEIAADAEAFEATLHGKPARRESLTYPWGWEYTGESTQRAFQAFCTSRTNQAAQQAPDAELDAAPELAASVLAWWDKHQYDTTQGGDGEEYNVFDSEPEFVTIARVEAGKGER